MAGRIFNDRKLSSEVRTLGLRKIKAILEDENHTQFTKELHDQVLLRLAGNLLPKLTELTGEDGEPLTIQIVNYGNNPGAVSVQSSPVSVGVPESSPEV